MKVYMTQYNSDMNEGRGPMVNSVCFKNRKHAERYIDSQSGVQGIRRKWSQEEYGDWRIEEIEVIEHDLIDELERKDALKKHALSKLSREEREALGFE